MINWPPHKTERRRQTNLDERLPDKARIRPGHIGRYHRESTGKRLIRLFARLCLNR